MNLRSTIAAAGIAAGVAAVAVLSVASVSTNAVATQPGDPDVRLATVDFTALVERGLRLEQYQGRLVEYETRWRSELEPAQTRYMEIVTQARGMTPDDPNYQALLEGEAALRAEIEGMNQEAQAELQTIQSEVFAEVYRLLQEGVEVKRAELGYDVVLASRSNDRDIVAPNLQAFTQELLFRPVIASNGDDITDAVAEMLSLPEPVDPTAVAPAGPEAPAADADGEVDEDGFTPVGDGEG